jgi:hypothetical protein
VSDVGFDGVVAALVCLWTIALGLGGAVLAGLIGIALRLPPDDERRRRVWRYVAGPLSCAATGVVFALACGVVDGQARLKDRLAPLCFASGLVLWVVVALRMRRRAAAPPPR